MTIEAAFTHFPALTTDRLHLRQVRPTDADALFAIKSEVAVMGAYGQEPHPSINDTKAWIGRLQTWYAQRAALFWCLTLRDDDTVIGSCTFWNFEPGFRCAELGYELNPIYWRQGFMTEAMSAILTHGFNELGLHRVEACPLAGNTPSRTLLLRLGFTYEGSLRQRVFFRDQFEDLLYYGLLRDEWPKPV